MAEAIETAEALEAWALQARDARRAEAFVRRAARTDFATTLVAVGAILTAMEISEPRPGLLMETVGRLVERGRRAVALARSEPAGHA